MTVKHPLILWAQRSPHIYLTIEVDDMKIENLSVEGDVFKLKGTKGSEVYEADLQLFGKLNGEERRQVATDRRVELIIPKETTEWWPRLLKEKTKVAWIKVDFDKWKDEDEEAEAEGNDAGGFGGMDFSQFGGMEGMNGMPGMGGLGGMPNFAGMGKDDMGDLDLDDEEFGEDDGPEPLEDINQANPEGTKTVNSSEMSSEESK